MANRPWDRQSRLQILAGARNFSVLQNVQTGSGVHPVSYSMGTKALSLPVQWSGHEADHWSQSSAKVNRTELRQLHHVPSCCAMDNFTFTSLFCEPKMTKVSNTYNSKLCDSLLHICTTAGQLYLTAATVPEH